MKFVKALFGYDHLWSVKEEDKKDELSLIFEQWNDADYLLRFFQDNWEDLNRFFRIEKLSKAISDTFDDAETLEDMILEFPNTENLDAIFRPLGLLDSRLTELSREKTRNWKRMDHSSWLRIYAIRLEPNVYIITGGTIKLTKTMQERSHTMEQLDRLNKCREFLISKGVFDKDSFIDLMTEE